MTYLHGAEMLIRSVFQIRVENRPLKVYTATFQTGRTSIN